MVYPFQVVHFNEWESDMDIHRTMGQLFMMGFDGTEVTEQIRALIKYNYLGTILLTAKNLQCSTLC